VFDLHFVVHVAPGITGMDPYFDPSYGVQYASPADLEAKAIARAKMLARAPREGVAQVKLALRRPAIEAIEARGAQERERWLDTWFSPTARQLIQSTVDRLTKR
jgi:enoyl-CoA hydratase/carnithine racemase